MEDLQALAPVAAKLAAYQRNGIVHAISLCKDAIPHLPAYRNKQPNELSAPGRTDRSPGYNDTMARNLALAMEKHAVNLGYNVDLKRHMIYVDDANTAHGLLAFFGLIFQPEFIAAISLLDKLNDET